MALKKVRKIGDPVLRETSSNIEKIDKRVLDLVSDMLDTLESEGGVGLAAPQIGVAKRIIIVRYEDKIETYVNPEIEVIEKKKVEGDEGCAYRDRLGVIEKLIVNSELASHSSWSEGSVFWRRIRHPPGMELSHRIPTQLDL